MWASVKFFDDDNIVRYLKDTCLLLIWISSLVIAIATPWPGSCRPRRKTAPFFPCWPSRLPAHNCLSGKFLGCWLACGLALLVFYLFFGASAPAGEHHWPLVNYLQAAVLHWAMLGMPIALVLLGSLVFTAPSSNATICLVIAAGILLVGGI